MTGLLSSPLLLFLLASMASTLGFASLNLRFFTNRQIVNSLGMAAATGCLLGLAITPVYMLVGAWPLSIMLAEKIGYSLADSLAGVLAAVWFYVLSERFFSEVIEEKTKRRVVLFGFYLLSAATGGFFSLVIMNILFLLYILLALLDCKKRYHDEKEIRFAKNIYYQQVKSGGIELQKKNNIYCLFIESYHSEEALKELYEFDDSDTTYFLEKNGFTDYACSYSNAPATIRSLETLLSGYNNSIALSSFYVLDALRDNKYLLEFYDTSSYVFGRYCAKDDFVFFYAPSWILHLYNWVGPFLSQSYFIRKLFVRGYDPFNTTVDYQKIYDCFSSRLQKRFSKPRACFLRFGALHINAGPPWRADHGDFSERYVQAVRETQSQIHKLVTTIIANDPDAVIIAMGDHGSLTHWNAENGQLEPDEMLRQRGVSVKQYALSLFGIRLAVRWPASWSKDISVLSPLNIFRYLFVALGHDSGLLQQLQTSFSMTAKYIVVRDGEVLPALKPICEEDPVPELLQRAEQGTATSEEFIIAARRLHGSKSCIDLLEKAIVFFPADNSLLLPYGDALCRFGDEKGLLYQKKYVDLYEDDERARYTYGTMLVQFGRYSEAAENLPDSRQMDFQQLVFYLLFLTCLGRSKDALAFCRNYLATLQTLDPFADFVTGIYFLERGLLEEARERMLERDVAPRSTTIRYRLIAALALVRQGRYEEAEAILSAACGERDGSGWSFRMLSHVQEKQGRVADAIRTLLAGMESKQDSGALMIALSHLVKRYELDVPQFDQVHGFAKKQMEYMTEKAIRTGAFNIPWYKKQLEGKRIFCSPVQHYITTGVCDGLTPSPWFNPHTYLLFNIDLWDAGVDPLLHFMDFGVTELRIPSFSCSPAAFIKGRMELAGDPFLFVKTISQEWVAPVDATPSESASGGTQA